MINNSKKAFCWPNNTGQGNLDGRWVRFGLKGSADIIGIAHDGKFLAVEVKTGKSKQSKHQQHFQRRIETLGGTYILARSESEVKLFLETI